MRKLKAGDVVVVKSTQHDTINHSYVGAIGMVIFINPHDKSSFIGVWLWSFSYECVIMFPFGHDEIEYIGSLD
jgi:hypothetical protein